MTPPSARVERFVVSTSVGGAEVPAVAVLPPCDDPLPVGLFLYGGGGNVETLVQLRPQLERWWGAGDLRPMVLASVEAGPLSFYLDDPHEGTLGETLVAERLLSRVRALFDVRTDAASTGVLGISMGGYGALKIAFARPSAFGAVAAVQPMVEPGFTPAQVPLRNRLHYPPGVPTRLLGPARDRELYERDHPAGRAWRNADALRRSGLAIYLEAGDDDAVNACDGAEFVHRVLWQLDIGHEYRLIHGADHGGPTLLPRLRDAAVWLGRRVSPEPASDLDPDEQALTAWIEAGMVGEPPGVIDPTRPVFLRWLRAQLEPARVAARAQDPTVDRRFGRLVSPEPPE